MASKFPVALDDAATMPVVADNTDDVLAAHHNNQSDAIQAVETKVGTGASAPTDGKFLKGNGAGSSAWSTISASDIPDLSSTYAPAAKGVTNGDSHNHDGGDGAQIDHTKLTNIGTNTHAQIDTFIGTKAQASGLASLDGSSKVVQDPANATATPTQNKIPIADGVGGKLASGWIPDLSATYAAAAKGVTNGDTHDHSGGDGSQIDYTTLANKPTIPTNLDSLTDVTITTPSSGHVLKFNGSAWVNDADLTGAGGGNSVYIEEGGVAKANSSASDLTINLDGTDFDTSVVGNAVTVTVNNGGIDHTAIANIGTTSHANIDLALTRLANTSGTNTGDQVVPVNEAGSANNFLTAYNSSTGAWSKAQPTWANINKATSSIADITTRSHTALSDIGTNTHATIDTHLASTSNPHLVTAAQVGAIPIDGWVLSADTWTYASATTFTIAGVDRTAMFPKGTKIKLTQTTAKYFYVVGSAFSTNTTITVTGGSDYTVANSAITDAYYSHQENPIGFPSRFTYTPTLTGDSVNPTLGSSTLVGKFTVQGGLCFLSIRYTVTTGGSFNAGSGIYRFSLPVTCAVNGEPHNGWGALVDYGTSLATCYPEIWSSGTTVNLIKMFDGSGIADISLTWANNDKVWLHITYPI